MFFSNLVGNRAQDAVQRGGQGVCPFVAQGAHLRQPMHLVPFREMHDGHMLLHLEDPTARGSYCGAVAGRTQTQRCLVLHMAQRNAETRNLRRGLPTSERTRAAAAEKLGAKSGGVTSAETAAMPGAEAAARPGSEGADMLGAEGLDGPSAETDTAAAVPHGPSRR